VLFAVLMCVLA